MGNTSSGRILIRADGRKNLGMGHISRAHLLASAINRIPGWAAYLLTKSSRETEVFLSNKSPNYDLIWLDQDLIFDNEVEIFRGVVDTQDIDLIITDLLESDLTNSYVAFLKSFGLPVTSILDTTDFFDLDVDLVINGNPNQPKFVYCGRAIHLSGPKYFIMDERYGVNKINLSSSSPKKILVCLGGTDHNNIIFRVLDALGHFEDVEIKIITSCATGYYQELINFCKLRLINVEIKLDIDSLVGEWSDVDFAITAGGNVLFERIASGTPGVTICQLPRQMEIAELFSENGVNINLGYGPSMTAEDIRIKLLWLMESEEWKKKQIELSKVVVPGNGLNKCIEKIIKLGT